MEVDGEKPEDLTTRKENLLSFVTANEEISRRWQQRDDPEFTPEERRRRAEEALGRGSGNFLRIYAEILRPEDLDYFRELPSKSDEETLEIEYFAKEVLARHNRLKGVNIKNRRWTAMKKMSGNGKYFCEAEMQRRNPLLYEQLIGKFLTDDEKAQKIIVDGDPKLSTILLHTFDKREMAKNLETQKEQEDSVMEEEDTSSDEEGTTSNNLWGEHDTAAGNFNVSESEKNILSHEFKSSMYSSFLQGKDEEFDYTAVDSNPDFVDWEAIGEEEQENYFDSESPEEAPATIAEDSEEDPLDAFMSQLEKAQTDQDLNDKMKNLQT